MYTSASLRLCAFAAALFLVTPASAQKAKDTLRIAANDQYSVLSPYDLPLDEASPFYNEIYSPLIVLNENTGQYTAELAKAWRHVDDLTLEFDLRDDITLHTGRKFDADDIMASINYAIDPQTKIRSKNRYT
ncbi:MAG: transporter substrate-binding protein, partial [Rhodospirillales bacterium]|nr:transporter substrate-binding protein [Rhodospirillales bacterium]